MLYRLTPSNPKDGEVWYNSTLGLLKGYVLGTAAWSAGGAAPNGNSGMSMAGYKDDARCGVVILEVQLLVGLQLHILTMAHLGHQMELFLHKLMLRDKQEWDIQLLQLVGWLSTTR